MHVCDAHAAPIDAPSSTHWPRRGPVRVEPSRQRLVVSHASVGERSPPIGEQSEPTGRMPRTSGGLYASSDGACSAQSALRSWLSASVARDESKIAVGGRDWNAVPLP